MALAFLPSPSRWRSFVQNYYPLIFILRALQCSFSMQQVAASEFWYKPEKVFYPIVAQGSNRSSRLPASGKHKKTYTPITWVHFIVAMRAHFLLRSGLRFGFPGNLAEFAPGNQFDAKLF